MESTGTGSPQEAPLILHYNAAILRRVQRARKSVDELLLSLQK